MICAVCSAQNNSSAQTCGSCGNALVLSDDLEPSLAVGTELRGGAYRVGKKLGKGGFAITYLGSEVKGARRVAVKEFYPDGFSCYRHGRTVYPGKSQDKWDEGREKFLGEAESLRKLSHSGIVQVYQSFEENNTAYIVMEYIPGRSLESILDDGRPIQERDALDWIEQAGDALQAVHLASMLHRDLKPANMLLAPGRGVVLIDFGAARQFTAGFSMALSTVLTPGYAPLEQWGERVKLGPYTDIYALAATLYHLVTGATPVSATDRASGVDLDRPSKLNPKISKSTDDAILWAMEMSAANRPQSVPEFLNALLGLQPIPSPKVQLAPKIAGGVGALAFKNGSASSLGELVQLCDRYPDEAEDYLFYGYIEKWLAQIGAAALAQTARTMINSYGSAKRKGLELFVREVCRAEGLDPWPALASQPSLVDLGKLPIGARTSTHVRLKNQGRGYAWGKVALQPAIPGVSVPQKFDGSHTQIDISVDVASAKPGAYRATLVVQPDGGPPILQIPLQLEVLPLDGKVQPASLSFGNLAFGARTHATVRLTNSVTGGRFLGQATLSPPISGIECTPKVDGQSPNISINVDTGGMEAGKLYSTSLILSTNAGTFKVPIRFATVLAWRTVWKWAIACAGATGVAFAALRGIVAFTLSNPSAWVLDYNSAGSDLLVLCGIITAIPAGWLALRIYLRKKNQKN